MLDTQAVINMPKKIKGFTLVELLIVIAIISILVTMVLIAINPIRIINDSRDAKKRSELNQVKTALQLYFNENNSYPANPNTLVSTYMRQRPANWAADYTYTASGTDYDAAVNLDNPTADDTSTATKCAAILGGVTGDYYVCPD